MRSSRSLWLLASIAAIAVLYLLMRLVPYHARSSPPTSIPDLSVTSPLNQPGRATVPVEAYEIYSALYQEPQTERLVFAEDSETDIPQVDGNCLKPSTPLEHEMFDAFVAANQQSHRWETRFTISTQYRLLSLAEAETAQRCIERREPHTASCEPYRQLQHVRYLGVPGFDRAHTRALVSVLRKCGTYCGSGGIFVVEKTGNLWHRTETTDFVRNCSWMY